MKEPWTVERFVQLLKQHDVARGTDRELSIRDYGGWPSDNWCVVGWLDIRGLVEELNERERQS